MQPLPVARKKVPQVILYGAREPHEYWTCLLARNLGGSAGQEERPPGAPMRSRRGFTLIEVVIALLIGGILTSIALTGFGTARGRFAVRGARNTFASLQARARAAAIEGGTITRLIVYTGGDSVAIVRNGVRLESVHFRNEFNVDVRAASDITLCMSPRGYAADACNSFTTPVTVTFAANADTASVRILPLGQLVY
ncbi:MAG: prepilin-type N-terminal cleavage/methylation domain-containing protein [Gemmatimonadetes bacterium]|nr:prepilin-type N-terminal cleavage/methylation domain-containing protein [Gemmatimonadota bacterium]